MESYDFLLSYRVSAFRLAFSILRDEADAEDALQDAMISAYTKYSSFRGDSFRSWFFTIVRNRCFDVLRHKRIRPVTSLDTNDYTWDNQDAHEMNSCLVHKDLPLEQKLEQQEAVERVCQCLGQLSGDYRKAIFLVDIQGMGYSEAAKVIGRPVGTVKSRLARGRAQITQMLNETPATSRPLSA